jgi:4-hydroxy-tetrahydrodipicolinate reductase
MNYKIGLLGASGRMGQEIASLSSTGYWLKSNCLELTSAVSASGKLTSIDGIPIYTMDEFPMDLVHVWIDFSRPAGTMALLDKIECPVLIGTTGFTDEQMKRIEQYSANQPVLLAANTSPGMNWLLSVLAENGLPSELGFDAVLFEEHHKNKKDAPSGTAKTLLKVLGNTGYDVQVQVSRSGDTKGIHTVRFVGDGEEIEITHRVNDRGIFAKGALLGAAFLCTVKKPGMYSMREVFKRNLEGENQ